MKWRSWLPTVVLAAAVLALSLFSAYPKWVEVVYSRAVYPAIASKIAWFTRSFGMSVGELLIPVFSDGTLLRISHVEVIFQATCI